MECNAVYATLGFAGVDLLMSFVAAAGITFVLQREFYVKHKGRRDGQLLEQESNTEG